MAIGQSRDKNAFNGSENLYIALKYNAFFSISDFHHLDPFVRYRLADVTSLDVDFHVYFCSNVFADSQSAIRFAYVDDSNPASLRIVDSDAENRSNYEGIWLYTAFQ